MNLRISPYRASCVIDSLDGSGPSAIAVGATYTINGSTGLTINVSAHTPGFSQISAGGWHTCAIAKSGRLLCWGDNSSGAVGLAGSNQRLVPEPVGTATDWASVSAGFQHTCAIKNSGALWCWGKNGNGQLGVAGAGSRFGPTRVGIRTDWAKVSAGYEHTCALTNASSIYCWGRADLGSIGVGDLMDKFRPILVSTLSNWTDISAGNGHTCAVNSSGRAWCWGFNGSGQLGIASTTNRTRPTEVNLHRSLSAISVSAGSDHTCAVVNSTGVIQTFCWGGNSGSQLGSGTLGDAIDPQFVSVLIDRMRPATSRSPMQLAAGGLHSCVLTTLKEVLCWGQGGHFQLGSRFSSFRPFHLDFLSNISSISTGDTHTCAVSSSGDGWCWGNAMHGRIGNGRAAGRALPTRLSSPFVD
ncbi:MAG: hypothetical protein K8963_07915 [Proteobacteria bacterium]|nr:hypothetical protein [Pseudomonadota bacterium]